MDLSTLQSWMQGALFRPETAQDTDDLITPGAKLSARECLAVYQRSYALRLLACMREQFPALAHALGVDVFNDFAREYLRERPAESWTLFDLGRRFPGYLEETRPDKDTPEAWVDFVVDLARFERQIFVVFDAPGQEGAPYADPGTPDDNLRLQPCFDLAAYSFPIAKYYHAVKVRSDPPIPAPERTWIALVRKDYVVRTFALTPLQHAFLSALQDGARIDNALSRVAELCGVSADEARVEWQAEGSPRKEWLDAGFFVPI